MQFVDFINAFKDEQAEHVSGEKFMYQLRYSRCEFKDNVEIALRMHLVLRVINCSAKRSFTKMKPIKNRLRTSKCNDRLFHLTLMSIEADILCEINFEDLVTEFAKKKARKVSLL